MNAKDNTAIPILAHAVGNTNANWDSLCPFSGKFTELEETALAEAVANGKVETLNLATASDLYAG